MPDSDRPLQEYVGPRWLVGGHLQTIYAHFLGPTSVEFRRERIGTADGDFWELDWLDAPDGTSKTPLIVLFHGLEGNSGSQYARALMARVRDLGWRGVIPHFRGCTGEPNLQPRAYHSGDHEEVGAMLSAIRARVAHDTPVYATGISLGGSALLNWLGRAGESASRTITAAAAVSAPLDLTTAGFSIDSGLNRVYAAHFLSTLRPKGVAMAQRFPGILDAARIRRAYSMRAFDDAVTAPLHGFANALDYWRRASSKPWLRAIELPTLVLNARNDPFIPAASLPGAAETSRAVTLEQPDDGGHSGFAQGPFPGNVDWLPRRLLHFFARGW